MSELIISNVVDINVERSSFTVRDMLRTPLSDSRCDNESMYDESIIGLGPSHHIYNSSDVITLARENPPSESGRDSTSLNVGIDIVGKNLRHFLGLSPHNAGKVVLLDRLGEVFIT